MPFKPIDVEKEYVKDRTLLREDVKALGEWVKTQPHLPEVIELQLILFLQSCYYRQEAAKSAIDKFFTVRTAHPEIFSCPSVEDLRFELGVGTIVVLPKTTPEGFTVLFMKLKDTKPENYRSIPQITTVDMVMLLELMQNGTKDGVLLLFDLTGLAFGHLTRFNLSALRTYFDYIQEGLPVRIKGIHFINTVFFMDKLMAIIKPLIHKNFVELMHFHNAIESLYEYIPQECLPADYGGQAPSVAELDEKNIENLVTNMDFFRWQSTQKLNQGKRVKKIKNKGVGIMSSSFKKLEVD